MQFTLSRRLIQMKLLKYPEIHLETPRLVCFNDKGFCRYYVGIKGSQKPCEWAYLSIETLEILKSKKLALSELLLSSIKSRKA
jgi:hypothetical protein